MEKRLLNDWQIDLSISDSSKHVAKEDWRPGRLFGENKRSCVVTSNGSRQPAVKINAGMEESLWNDWQVDLLKSDGGDHVAEGVN